MKEKREEEWRSLWCATCSLLLGFRNPKLRDTSLSLYFFLSFFLSSFPFSLPKKTRLERFRFCVRHCKVFASRRRPLRLFFEKKRERLRSSGEGGVVLAYYACESRAFLCLSGSEKHHQLLYWCVLLYTPPKRG